MGCHCLLQKIFPAKGSNPGLPHCRWTLYRLSHQGSPHPSANAGDMKDTGLIPGLGRSPGEGHDNPLKYSCLENPMDREAWRATVHKVTKSRTQPSDFTTITTTTIYNQLTFLGGSEVKASAWNVGDPGSILGLGRSPGEENCNPHQYSCLENPMEGEPGRLQSMGSQRVRHY